MRRLIMVTAPVLAGLLLLLLSSRESVPAAGAATPTPTPPPTAPPVLPGRFAGTVTLFGKKPSGSVKVTAYVGSAACGAGPVKSGVYAVNVPSAINAPGCGAAGATVTFKVGDYWATETGVWKMGEPQVLDLTGPKMRTVALAQGCSNQATLTFSNKTPIATIRAAVEPTANLTAVWKWNAKSGQWDGDFPGAPAGVNTLKSVDRLDSVWICASGPATLTEPAVDFS